MKLKLIQIILLLLVSSTQLYAAVSKTEGVQNQPIVLAVVSELSKTEFNEKLFPMLTKELAECSECQFLNLTPYSEKGLIQTDSLISTLEQNAGKFHILFFDFNEKMNNQNKSLFEFLQKISEQNIVLVAAAGQPRQNEPSSMLTKTIFGQIKKAVIIGEIGEKDRLIGQSYYGPEMLTALRPPKEFIGQGYSPILFSTRLTKNFHKRADWPGYLNEKKLKSKKIWLDLNDLFM